MEATNNRVYLNLNSFVVLVLSLQCIVLASVALDLPVIRQVAGFLYLSLAPGITLMRALRLQEQTTVEQVSFSIGLSVALLMFLGWSVNAIGPLIGVRRPLSLFPLLLPLSVLILTMCTYIFLTEKGSEKNEYVMDVKENRRLWPETIVLFGLPLLSVLGSLLVRNVYGNAISLLLILGISALFFLTAVSRKITNTKLFPLAIGTIAIALLLQTALVSPYINGYDLHGEYYVFSLTKSRFFWNPSLGARSLSLESYGGMLSVTILPTFYSIVLNLSGEFVFKIVYPLLFSVVPVALFYVYTKLFEEKRAILSVFLFISFATFYVQMAYLARQMIAELFFVLLLLLYLQKSVSRKKAFILITFSFALVVSHYAMAYLCIFFVFFFVLTTLGKNDKLSVSYKAHLFFLLVLTFTWNIYISTSAPFLGLTHVLQRIIIGFSDLFTGRDPNVLRAIGMAPSVSFWRTIGRYVFYATEIFILLGFSRVILSRKKLKFNKFYISGQIASLLLLFSCIFIPFFSMALNTTRIFHISLFFLAPAFVTGAESFFNFVFNNLNRLRRGFFSGWNQQSLTLVSGVIVVFFLFQSGFIFALTGDIPTSPSLTTDKSKALTNLSLYDSYTFVEEVFGAQWISAKISNQSRIYCDYISGKHVLLSYALLDDNNIFLFSNDTEIVDDGAYIYLRHLNIVHRVMENPDYVWILPENSSLLQMKNKIYANEGCEIYAGLNVLR